LAEKAEEEMLATVAHSEKGSSLGYSHMKHQRQGLISGKITPRQLARRDGRARDRHLFADYEHWRQSELSKRVKQED